MKEHLIRQHLKQEPRIASLLEDHVPRERDDYGGDVYFGLLRSIAYQQLSGAAAGTIFGRFLDLFNDGYPHARQLLEFSVEDLRAVGMSRPKAGYLLNVAEFWQEHGLINTDWSGYADQEILDLLIRIKGVGQWTVEMVLMFVLRRPDLLPLDDLVVRRNLIRLFEIDEEKFRGRKLNEEILRVTEPWRPYRSYASRVMWAWG